MTEEPNFVLTALNNLGKWSTTKEGLIFQYCFAGGALFAAAMLFYGLIQINRKYH